MVTKYKLLYRISLICVLMSSGYGNARDMSAHQNAVKYMLVELKDDPSIRAFLDTIAFAEGTYDAGKNGYKLRYPENASFQSYESHPGTVICAPYKNGRLCSTASGRYMFLRKTWDSIARRIELNDFGPFNQDLAAIYLLHEKQAVDDIQQGRFEDAIYKVRDIWASLPGAPYGQPRKKLPTLKKRFDERVRHYQKYLR